MRISSIATLVGLSLCVLASASCKASEEDVRAYITEELGCTDVTLKRGEGGGFTFEATCGGEFCMGSVSMDGSSSTSSKICMPAASKKPEASAPPVGPGKIALGEGGVTGFCEKGAIERALTENSSRFKACYDRDLAKFPTMAGTIPIFWTIGQDGKAADISIPFDADPPPVIACLEEVFESTDWVKPERGMCRAQWTLGVYLDQVPEEKGHDRLPRSHSCVNPIAMVPGVGESLVEEKDLGAIEKSWELSTLTIFMKGDDADLYLEADNFGASDGAEGRKTLVCHTQDLVYTITTSTDKDGKETKTRGFSEENSTTTNASVTLPQTILAGRGEIATLRVFDSVLRNGVLESKLSTKKPEESYTLAQTVEEMGKQKFEAKMIVLRRGENALVVRLYADINGFELFAQGTYAPAPK